MKHVEMLANSNSEGNKENDEKSQSQTNIIDLVMMSMDSTKMLTTVGKKKELDSIKMGTPSMTLATLFKKKLSFYQQKFEKKTRLPTIYGITGRSFMRVFFITMAPMTLGPMNITEKSRTMSIDKRNSNIHGSPNKKYRRTSNRSAFTLATQSYPSGFFHFHYHCSLQDKFIEASKEDGSAFASAELHNDIEEEYQNVLTDKSLEAFGSYLENKKQGGKWEREEHKGEYKKKWKADIDKLIAKKKIPWETETSKDNKERRDTRDMVQSIVNREAAETIAKEGSLCQKKDAFFFYTTTPTATLCLLICDTPTMFPLLCPSWIASPSSSSHHQKILSEYEHSRPKNLIEVEQQVDKFMFEFNRLTAKKTHSVACVAGFK
ncbi:hypothetical protein RFI_26471 [Reticulomyxa filosa]|uniref:Uncharacterized protein n=1 Tax=Reticulomyxa filosa TaxID=46433 RepID=X6MB91_RETFI|nr:hypothetical protein RFI_26471 [Reticulomyxa filosa]|eukprot:ETO10906.1 hypothetical protein RFI_26471 [Reticulomyxa filosa]